MNSVIDVFFKIGTPVGLLFVGVAVLMSTPKVERLNKTLGNIQMEVQEISRLARNPAPVMFDISKATATGLMTGLQQRTQDVREKGLESDTLKSATETAREAASAASSFLRDLTTPAPSPMEGVK